MNLSGNKKGAEPRQAAPFKDSCAIFEPSLGLSHPNAKHRLIPQPVHRRNEFYPIHGSLSRPCLPYQSVSANIAETDIMKTSSFSAVPPDALAVIDQYITQALDANDRATLAGLRAALACLSAITPAADMAKLEARAEAAVRYVGGSSHV